MTDGDFPSFSGPTPHTDEAATEIILSLWKKGFDDFLALGTLRDTTLGSNRKGYYLSLSKSDPWGDGCFEITIADVWMDEQFQHHRVFPRVLDHIEAHPLVVEVAVGNIKNQDLRPFLRRRNYSDEVTHCVKGFASRHPSPVPPGHGKYGKFCLAVTLPSSLSTDEASARRYFRDPLIRKYPGLCVRFVTAIEAITVPKVEISWPTSWADRLFGPLYDWWPYNPTTRAFNAMREDADRLAAEFDVR